MPKQDRKIDLKKLDYNEILDYIRNLKREKYNYKVLYQRAQKRCEDLLLKYEKPKEIKPPNKYLINEFELKLY